MISCSFCARSVTLLIPARPAAVAARAWSHLAGRSAAGCVDLMGDLDVRALVVVRRHARQHACAAGRAC
eukprot:scaffold35936_cov33-Phaeocystis_antarctica.AAC.1